MQALRSISTQYRLSDKLTVAPAAKGLREPGRSRSGDYRIRRTGFGRISMNKTTRYLAAIAATFSFVPLATLAQAAELTPQEQALVDAARQEGSVTLINPLFSDRTGQLLGEAFVKRYDLGPDFKFNNLRKGTGAVAAQVRQEIQAGTFTVDAIMVSAPGFFATAADHGAFEALDSGYWKDHEKLATAAGQYFNYPYVVVPLAYAFQPVWNTSCDGMSDVNITNYADTVDPALKGKTIASDLTKSFTLTNTAISLQENGVLNLDDYWQKLKATDPVVEFRTEPKMQMVISCQRPLDMWNLAGRVYQNVLKDPTLKDKIRIGSYEEGEVMLGNQIAVIKGAAHPNAAKLLVEFLLSKEGTDVVVEGEAVYSFLDGYKPPAAAAPYLLDMSMIKLLGMKDWVAAQGEFEKVQGDWQKVFQ
jgi:iron(III) transport system substrate-binding protein